MKSSKRFPSLLFLTGAACLGLMTGCGTVVTVDSLARKSDAVSYELHNENPLLADDSLRYKEVADYMRTALSGKGMYEAPPGTKPDLVVGIDFSIGPPETRRERREEAIYRSRPGPVYTETVQSGTDANGNPTYSTITYRGPDTQEFVGTREIEYVTTVYEKRLQVIAREANVGPDRLSREIWSVDASSEGESRDLRKSLPVLAASTIEYIGQDSGGQRKIRVKDKSPDVVFIKKGMGTPTPAQQFASVTPSATK